MRHLARMFLDTASNRPDSPAMTGLVDGTWRTLTFRHAAAWVREAAAGLIGLGIQPGDRVAILSANRPEWAIADYAIMAAGGVTVPLYATSPAATIRRICADAGVRFLFAGTRDGARKVREVFGDDDAPGILGFDDDAAPDTLESIRRATDGTVDDRLAAASPSDIATLIYTSGTTGEPKGVILTHANFFHQIDAVNDRFDIGDDDRSLCVLPLSHAFERAWSYYIAHQGAHNIYLGDPRGLAGALTTTKPTCLVGVPRLFEKVQEAAIARAGSGVKRRIFDWALQVGNDVAHAEQPGPLLRIRHLAARALVLRRLEHAFGGPKRAVAAGGAPLRPDIAEFFLSFGVLLCEGYGLTETSPMVTCNWPGAARFGTVGKPVKDVEVTFADDGEILVRGPNVMTGYFGKPEETARVLVDGWFHTGDVGHLDEAGYLVVTDRIKDLIVTSNGKNVAPAPIESLLAADPLIDQAVVIGDRRSYLTALVQPAFEQLEKWAKAAGLAWETRESLVTMPRVVTELTERVRAATASLVNHEQVRRITVLARELTQDAGELTPTLKVRRKATIDAHTREIDSMYR